ncbi:MAG: hypothetical protein IPJ17_13190 [Holophagales bacterium]|nr:MAG: hypothetical protein IPJ17_13190 [Holophagales bacterium]
MPQVVAQGRGPGVSGSAVEAEPAGDRRQHEPRIGHGLEGDEHDTNRFELAESPRGFDRQARLAGAAGAGECHQSLSTAPQPVEQLGDLVAPRDERGPRGRQRAGVALGLS